MVIFAVGRNRTGTMMTFTNVFLSNLALMDLLRVVFCMPSAVILDVTENWYLGTSMCKIIAFIEVFTIFVSELTLSYIAYDRWKCLQDPFKPTELSSVQKPKIVILLMWTLAAILSLPEPFMSAVMPSPSVDGDKQRNYSTIEYATMVTTTTTCSRDWSKETDAFYVIIKITFSFFCPLLFMLVIYSKVIRYLWKHNTSTPQRFYYGSTSRGSFHEPLTVRSLNRQWMYRFYRRKQTIKMMIAITVVYNLSYLPVYIMTIIEFFIAYKDEKLKTAIKMMAQWFCYITAAVAPIIYGLMSVRFRAEFNYMCKNPTSYCCWYSPKVIQKDKAKLSMNVEGALEGEPSDKLSKPLMTFIREVPDTCHVHTKEEIAHQDLVSKSSNLSQSSHKTLSRMASDTSGSTNCTKSTNFSSDGERMYPFESSYAIPEEITVDTTTNVKTSLGSGLQDILSLKEIAAQVHQTSIERSTSFKQQKQFSTSGNEISKLVPMRKCLSLPKLLRRNNFTGFTMKNNPARSKSCPIPLLPP